MSEPITVKNLRKIFEDSTGLPRKECLKTSIELLEKLGVKTSKLTKAERHYIINFIGATTKHLRDMYRNHHCNFLSIKKPDNKYVYHGFSENQDFIENNLARVEKRAERSKVTYKKVLQLTKEMQLLLEKKVKNVLE